VWSPVDAVSTPAKADTDSGAKGGKRARKTAIKIPRAGDALKKKAATAAGATTTIPRTKPKAAEEEEKKKKEEADVMETEDEVAPAVADEPESKDEADTVEMNGEAQDVETQAPAKKPRKPFRFHPGNRAKLVVKKLQKNVRSNLALSGFVRLVRWTAVGFKPNVRFQARALRHLRVITEGVALRILQEAMAIMRVCNKERLTPQHLALAASQTLQKKPGHAYLMLNALHQEGIDKLDLSRIMA
jgi:hypothetical protein